MKGLLPSLPQVHLNPGELFITHDPCLVVTLLGSCVAVTMFNTRLNFAAICHAMLPRPKRRSAISLASSERFRYLSEVIPAMVERFSNLGLVPREVEVKLFGGGNVIRVEERMQAPKGLGHLNVETARELLVAHSLTIRASNVGGTVGRKIMFNTQTGAVLHKHLGR